MSQAITYPDYNQITDALRDTSATISPAEAHGLLCGVICATPDTTKPEWERLVLGTTPDPSAFDTLQQLFLSSVTQMSEFELEFTLVLPDDEVSINDRAEALGTWCQGFLVGLQQGTLSLGDNAEAEGAEALNDIAEIAQVSYGDIASAEEDETAYVELVEYVRLAVLMLYHEFRTVPPGSATSNDNLLH